MPKAVIEDIGKFNHHYPKVAVIVTASVQGRRDAMTAAWHSSISFTPPLYGVSVMPNRFTYRLLAESKEFGINFIPFEKASLAAQIGGISGQKTDKFQQLGIETEKPARTEVPVLKDAYVTYECKLVDSRPYGTHIWIVGEIVAVRYLEEALAGEGILNMERVKPLLYFGSDFYAAIDGNSLSFIKKGM